MTCDSSILSILFLFSLCDNIAEVVGDNVSVPTVFSNSSQSVIQLSFAKLLDLNFQFEVQTMLK